MIRIRTRLAAAAAAGAAVVASLAAVAPTADAAAAQATTAPLAPVASVDLQRYLGDWNQVAAIPQIFQIQCARDSRATYTAVDASTIGVRNTCRTWLGFSSSVTGQATVLDPTTNAQLRVNFNGIPNFGDTSQPNYVITYLSPDYSTAIVGDPARRSGFVLSRTPDLQGITWSQIRDIVTERGYDACKFRITPVAGGRQDRSRLCTL
ncbi:hypothetical protein GCM10022215_16990 [Nocardioides fonticola]|uniref:Lipocalin/cytosolic fatty-acid binding domain-containing protein n=1 Tax=Nocardioides fonticola TaxID=450363 RepID=A0ABP7XID2_9ACTN